MKIMDSPGQKEVTVEKSTCHKLSSRMFWFAVSHMENATQDEGAKVLVYILKCMLLSMQRLVTRGPENSKLNKRTDSEKSIFPDNKMVF